MKKYIILFIIALMNTTVAFAQKSIDKIIKDIPDNKRCEVTYGEERNPKTKAVIRSKIVALINSDDLARKLEIAFRKERDNAVSIKLITKEHYIKLTFCEPSSVTSEYTLQRQNNKQWLLIAQKKGASLISERQPKRMPDKGVSYDDNAFTATALTFVEE